MPHDTEGATKATSVMPAREALVSEVCELVGDRGGYRIEVNGQMLAYTVPRENAEKIKAAFNSHAALVKALEEAKECIADIGSGKGGWAWEEVIDRIDAALQHKETGE